MKKAISKSLKILIAVIVLIAIVTVILLVIKPNQVAPLTAYSRVSVYVTATDRIDFDTADESDNEALSLLNEGLKKSRYNIMHGILEWKANAALRLGTREEADPDNEDEMITVPDTVKAADFNSAAGEGEYKLLFCFAEMQSVEIEDVTIAYDRAVVLVHDSENEIDTVTVYFYEDARIGNQSLDPAIGSAYYEIYRVEMRIIATRLYNAATDIIELRRG